MFATLSYRRNDRPFHLSGSTMCGKVEDDHRVKRISIIFGIVIYTKNLRESISSVRIGLL
jgi:hypothetical protein